ncbi:hypothetical protein [Acinetobacter kyonggiensis]|uniref:Uncharacterized protein n=1 Tax=Acinetobacter kyonggiensis TaxID=595670 RepID=A0A1H3KGB9_9GAMM|nr:hypothetical protein [Acinetobacter kyonggiensis]SDY51242.1 hypothetical protein SAMN05421643_11274 [Acinetobacter kyonggiensis]
MEIKQLKQIEVVTDVVCDVCNQSTKLEFGALSAHWGYGSKHDGERYELQLCEKYFFYALATLKRKHLGEQIFDENFDPVTLDEFGLK